MQHQRKEWEEVFHDAAKWPEHRVYAWKAVKGTETAAAFKTVLRTWAEPGKAHSITLSRDLVWAVSELSRKLDPMYLYEKVLNTRMPFPLTIFDWTGEDRRLAYNDMHIAQEQEDQHPENEIPAIAIVEKADGGKYIHFLSYDFVERYLMFFPISFLTQAQLSDNTPGNDFKDVLKKCGFSVGTVAEFMFTTSVVLKHPETKQVVDDPRIRSYCIGPVFSLLALQRDKQKMVRGLLSGVSGQFRWLGALLALLDRPTMVRYVDTVLADPAVPGKPKGVPKATSQNQTLTLMLPREKVVTKVVHLTERERKKVGKHEVGGHWCYSHRRGNPDCRHVWPKQPTSRQQCEKDCGAVRWRRESYERGEGDVLKHKQRRATFTGMSVERLTTAMKEEAKT